MGRVDIDVVWTAVSYYGENGEPRWYVCAVDTRWSNMFKPSLSVTVTDNLPELTKRVKRLSNYEVLVGVPEEDADRQKNPENGPITNAQLAYVHTHGSPIHKIPARPIIEPAIEDLDNQEGIAVYLKKAAEFALDGEEAGTLAELKKAGMKAQNAVRHWFTNPKNNWAPLADSTIEARARRKYKISKYKKAETKQKYRTKLADYIKEGIFLPLIDTTQLRKSMIFQVRKKD
jgi:hypothetical protein